MSDHDTAIPHETGKPAKRSAAPVFNPVPVSEIMAMQFEPVRWAVPGYVPEGLTILAGRQKLGKTWLALDLAIAVAAGGNAIGSVSCTSGDVLYIDLENGHRRIQDRLRKLAPENGYGSSNGQDRFQVATEAPALDKGLIAHLDRWRTRVDNPRLVVIDVLQRVKPAGKASRNAFENDYAALSELQRWATENRLAVLLLHHTRKGGADDPLEALNGSNGLSACADTTLVLDRDAQGTTLYVRGRDVEERETAIGFDGGLWTVLGAASDVRRSGERSRILTELLTADSPMTPSELVAATGMRRNGVDQLLYKMAKAGEIMKAERGKYVHPNRTDLLGSCRTPDKIDKKVRNPRSEPPLGREISPATDDRVPSGNSVAIRNPVRNSGPPTGREFGEMPDLPAFLRR